MRIVIIILFILSFPLLILISYYLLSILSRLTSKFFLGDKLEKTKTWSGGANIPFFKTRLAIGAPLVGLAVMPGKIVFPHCYSTPATPDDILCIASILPGQLFASNIAIQHKTKGWIYFSNQHPEKILPYIKECGFPVEEEPRINFPVPRSIWGV